MRFFWIMISPFIKNRMAYDSAVCMKYGTSVEPKIINT